MTIVKGPENAGPVPPALFGAIDALGQEATKQGVMVEMGGLMPSAQGAKARLRKGTITITDGPFTESKEVFGGYAVYNLKSLDEAKEWTRRFLQLHIDHWPAFDCEVEIRPMYDMPPIGG
jgi:hypothetical protein